MTKAVNGIFGFEKDIQFGAKGRRDSMKVRMKRAIIHGEMSQMKYEVSNLTGAAFIPRLDLHAQSSENSDGLTPLTEWEMVTLATGGAAMVRHSKDKFSHRVRPAPLWHKDLRNLSLQRSIIIAEGVYRVATQLLGLANAGVLLSSSSRCLEGKNLLAVSDAANVFAKYNWHRGLFKKDIVLWCGASAKGNRRAYSAYKGTVMVNDIPSMAWGMYNVDEKICGAALRAIPDIRTILLDTMLEASYEREIGASSATNGKEKLRDTSFGFLDEKIDHRIMKVLYDACALEANGMWEEKLVIKRLERVYSPMARNVESSIGGNAFSVPIVEIADENTLKRVRLRVMPTFMRPRTGGKGGYEGVFDELPKISVTGVAEIQDVSGGESHPDEAQSGPSHGYYRNKRRLSIWQLHMGYLREVKRVAKDEDLKHESMVKCVTRIMTGLGCTVPRARRSAVRLEGIESAYLKREMANPLRKKRATTDDCILNEMEEAFCEFHPPNSNSDNTVSDKGLVGGNGQQEEERMTANDQATEQVLAPDVEPERSHCTRSGTEAAETKTTG